MIERLKDLEQEALDNLDPEVYDEITSNVMEEGEQWIYQSGYIDGLQTAIRILHEEIDDTQEYSIEMDDIFGDLYDENGDEVMN